MHDRDPKRLRELAPADSRLGRGLTAARGRGPSEAELRALGAAVLGASTVGATTANAGTKAGAASVKAAGLTKATLALAVAGALAGTAGVAWNRHPARPAADQEIRPALRVPAATSQPGADVVPLAPVAPVEASADRPAPHVERRRAPVAPITAQPQPGPAAVEAPLPTVASPLTPTDADEELRLVSAAQRALPHDPALALGLAREHARRFPDGALAQERDAVAISALWETGRRDQARERARRFLEEHPGSTYAGRMHDILRQAAPPVP